MEKLDILYDGFDSTIARDLKLNLKRVVAESSLTPQESLPALLAVAASVGAQRLVEFAKEELKSLDFVEEQIREAAEVAAIMGMLNTYYRTRHMLVNEDDYKTTGLRMMSLAKPLLGKERFEMLAFAVSTINGCETCIRSHEQVLRQAGVVTDKIHDLIRLAAVVKGLSGLEPRNPL